MTRWLHYIGGFYSPDKLIREARRLGVSRRIAPALAGAFEYGDTVALLSWRAGLPQAFAEFTVSKITFPAEIAQTIGEQLIVDGKASVSAGAGLVVRECGSYFDAGGYSVAEDVKLSDLVKRAKALAADHGLPLTCLIGGPLTKVYNPAFTVNPPPPFIRGFMRVKNESLWEAEPSGTVIEGEYVAEMRGVEQYQKRRNKERKDVQMKLLTAGGAA